MWSPSRLRPPTFGRIPAPTDGSAALELAPPAAERQAPVRSPGESGGGAMLTVEYSYTRGQLQPVLQAIRDTLGLGAVPLDTPLRLQEAVAAVIGSVSGAGDVVVRRSPAALLTPEYWHIRLEATDQRTLDILVDVVGRRIAR